MADKETQEWWDSLPGDDDLEKLANIDVETEFADLEEKIEEEIESEIESEIAYTLSEDINDVITDYVCNTTKALLEENVPWSVPFDELDGYKGEVVRELMAQQDKELIDALAKHSCATTTQVTEVLKAYDSTLFTDDKIQPILTHIQPELEISVGNPGSAYRKPQEERENTLTIYNIRSYLTEGLVGNILLERIACFQLAFPTLKYQKEKIILYVITALAHEDNHQYSKTAMIQEVRADMKVPYENVRKAIVEAVQNGLLYEWGPTNKSKTISLLPEVTTTEIEAPEEDALWERIGRECQASADRIPLFGNDDLNKVCNGGLMRTSMMGFIGKTKEGKSYFVANCAASLLQKGYKVLLYEVEAGPGYYLEQIGKALTGDPDITRKDVISLRSAVGEYTKNKQLFIPKTARPVKFEHLMKGIENYQPDFVVIDYLEPSFFDIKVEQGNIVQTMVSRLRDEISKLDYTPAVMIVLPHKMKGNELEVCGVVGNRWMFPLDLAIHWDWTLKPQAGSTIAINDYEVAVARGAEYGLLQTGARFHTEVDVAVNRVVSFSMGESKAYSSIQNVTLKKGK